MRESCQKLCGILTVFLFLTAASDAYGQYRQGHQGSSAFYTNHRPASARPNQGAPSHPLTSGIHPHQSNEVARSQLGPHSRPGAHAGLYSHSGSIHPVPAPSQSSASDGRLGTERMNNAMQMQRSGSLGIHKSGFESVLAARGKNQRNSELAKERLAGQSRNSIDDRTDLQKGRNAGGALPRQSASNSGGQGRPNQRSDGSSHGRRN